MELGLIRKVDLDDEMQQSYLDYAMSVIVSRALPDARDGLKPVQRRILYAMFDMGLRPDSAYKKSARIVGEVLGKYHPHGDMAVYEAMARLAQDFSMRYPLVDGQGNFGSVDGDPPAAMRYTEARLTKAAMEMLNQLDKDTVDFIPNFDESLGEPTVLPAAIPNLLVNGATGIAVGMATNIPPHNLGEVVDALVYMLEQWDKLDDLTVENLLHFIQGPDFPTGGVIIQDPLGEGLMSAYGSGRGRVIVQARAHMEEMVRGRNRIIVTELPYQTNKAALVERIADLVRDGQIEGISDLRDESDRQGMRMVIELSKTAEPEKILRQLYHHTPMQSTFGINLLALVDGEPRLLTLKQALRVYLDHRLMIIKRRSQYDLEKAKARAHILEGLRIALNNLDEVISLIRNAPDAEQARVRLIKRFKLSEIQAQAILDMPLRRLASLERKKIELEYKEINQLIKDLEALLKSPKKMRQVVIDELLAIKEAYADRRRTMIVRLKEGESTTTLLTTTDVTPAQTVWIGVTQGGKIARTPDEQLPNMDGDEAPRWLVHADTHQTLYLVTTQGKAAAIPVHAVPEAPSLAQGTQFYKVTPLDEGDVLADLFTLSNRIEDRENSYIVTVTRHGLVKKSELSELPGPSAQTFPLVKINEGDSLGWIRLTSGQDEILLATSHGMAIRFTENEVRPMGLVAAGVGGIKLTQGDALISAEKLPQKGEVLLVASNGKAKRVKLEEFPVQGRFGQGIQAWKLPAGTHLVGAHAGSFGDQVVLHIAGGSPVMVKADAAPVKSRAVQGSTIAGVKSSEEIVAITPLHHAVPVSHHPVPVDHHDDGRARADGKAKKKPAISRAKEARAVVGKKPTQGELPGLSPEIGNPPSQVRADREAKAVKPQEASREKPGRRSADRKTSARTPEIPAPKRPKKKTVEITPGDAQEKTPRKIRSTAGSPSIEKEKTDKSGHTSSPRTATKRKPVGAADDSTTLKNGQVGSRKTPDKASPPEGASKTRPGGRKGTAKAHSEANPIAQAEAISEPPVNPRKKKGK